MSLESPRDFVWAAKWLTNIETIKANISQGTLWPILGIKGPNVAIKKTPQVINIIYNSWSPET